MNGAQALIESLLQEQVEHIFGYIQTVFTGSFVRSIASSGLRRTTG